MLVRAVVLLLFCFGLSQANECNEPFTEWTVVFEGVTYVDGTSVFEYTINTENDPALCPAGRCQALSHWVLIVDCEPSAIDYSPSATCGPDGQYTIVDDDDDDDAVIGYKWEPNENENNIVYTITFDGCVGLTTVKYLVKGSTRCGHDSVQGPDLTAEGACDFNECSSDADCEDGIGCTTNTCVSGSCEIVYDELFCEDGFSCTLNECVPGSEGADIETGCRVTERNGDCDDGFGCTLDTCSPGAPGANPTSGCVASPVDESCEDGFSCTLNECVPGSEDADIETGCRITERNGECDDGFGCTLDTCSPGAPGSSPTSGCVASPVDESCEDGFSCTLNECVPGSEGADIETGCRITERNGECDDGFGCTLNACSPDTTGASETTGCVFLPVHDSCNDNVFCTDDSCSPTDPGADMDGCLFTSMNDLCVDPFACTDNLCTPDDVNADANGCTFPPQNQMCEDGFSCTSNICSPLDDQADEAGCTFPPQHNECVDPFTCTENLCDPSESTREDGCYFPVQHLVCEDGYGCTDDFCAPEATDADGVSGCRHDYFDSRCGDGIDCTDDTCTPSSLTLADGCLFTENDDNCEDNNICTNDFCLISEEGCYFEPNTAPCDDLDECTGTLESPDQCAGGSCQPGGQVCPPQTSAVYAGQHYYAGDVTITNDDSFFYVSWNANSQWISNEFHIYLGTVAPAKSAPGKFPFNFNLAMPVNSAQFTIPFPSDVGCGTDVFFAFHLVVNPNGNNICSENDCTTSSETGWMEGDDAPDGWHQWGNYGDFTTCCCAGFSHLEGFGDGAAVDMVYVPTTNGGRKGPKGASVNGELTEEELVERLSAMLGHPAHSIVVVSLEYQGNSVEEAVVGFLDANNVAGSTIANMLLNADEATFEEFGLSEVLIAPVDVNMDNYDYFESSSSTSSSASALAASLLLLLFTAFA